MPSDLQFSTLIDLHTKAVLGDGASSSRPAARCAEKDPLAGAVVWTHDTQVHMLVLPGQRSISRGRVLTSCGTRGSCSLDIELGVAAGRAVLDQPHKSS